MLLCGIFYWLKPSMCFSKSFFAALVHSCEEWNRTNLPFVLDALEFEGSQTDQIFLSANFNIHFKKMFIKLLCRVHTGGCFYSKYLMSSNKRVDVFVCRLLILSKETIRRKRRAKQYNK